MIEEPHLRRPATPDEVLAGLVQGSYEAGIGWFSGWTASGTRFLTVAAAGLLAALLAVSLRGLRRAAGAFGIVVAAALATVLTAFGWTLDLATTTPWGGAVTALVAALVSAPLAPLCRDRGMLSLALVSLAVGGGAVTARRAALDDQQIAYRFARARDAVLQQGWTELIVSAPADTPLTWRQALARSLWPPLATVGLRIAAAIPDGEIESRLLAVGWRGVRLIDNGVETIGDDLAARPSPPPFPNATLRPRDANGPVVVGLPERGAFVLWVVTPAGSVRGTARDPGAVRGLRLWGPAADTFAELTAPLPRDMPIWASVEMPTGERLTPWLQQ